MGVTMIRVQQGVCVQAAVHIQLTIQGLHAHASTCCQLSLPTPAHNIRVQCLQVAGIALAGSQLMLPSFAIAGTQQLLCMSHALPLHTHAYHVGGALCTVLS